MGRGVKSGWDKQRPFPPSSISFPRRSLRRTASACGLSLRTLAQAPPGADTIILSSFSYALMANYMYQERGIELLLFPAPSKNLYRMSSFGFPQNFERSNPTRLTVPTS